MATQKTITFYQCDICKKGFDTEAEAVACQASHGTISIDRLQYGTSKITGTFPEALVLTDGVKKAKYVFLRELKSDGESNSQE